MEVYISKFLKDKSLNLEENKYVVIIDVPKEEFLKNIIYLYNNLLLKLFFLNKKVIIEKNPFKLENIKISSLFLHTNKESIDYYLYLEAWNNFTSKEKLIKLNKYKLDYLNHNQYLATQIIEGPVCVIAPAGSGKTKTLINRLLNLCNNGISSKTILVLAFNTKAKEEVLERLKKYKITDINVKTFHSFGYDFLKTYTNMHFSDEKDISEDLEILESIIYNEEKYSISLREEIISKINELLPKIKNNLISKEEMKIMIQGKEENIYHIFEKYQRRIKNNEFFNFEDMLYLTVLLLLENAELRREIQNKYQYILVDEYQDLNNIEHLLIKILALPTNNLFVVGDDDQMIYDFCGASTKGIMRFKYNYPLAKIIKLDINYRSNENIVNLANKVISNNNNRINKTIKASKKTKGTIDFFIEKNFLEEGKRVIEILSDLKEETIILYRYNEYGLFIKYLLYLNGYEILEKEISHINKIVLPILNNIFKENKLFDNKKVLIIKGILKTKDLSFKQVSRFLNLKTYIEPKYRKLNLDIEFNTFYEILASIIDSSGGIKSFYNYKYQRRNQKLKVLTSTIHKTKGNEYENVIYFHLEHKNLKELENERRVEYVAITRAKKNLFITCNYKSDLAAIKEVFLNEEYKYETIKELEERIKQLSIEKQENILSKKLIYKDLYQIRNSFNYQVNEKKQKYNNKRLRELKNNKKNRIMIDKEIKKIEEEILNRRKLKTY